MTNTPRPDLDYDRHPARAAPSWLGRLALACVLMSCPAGILLPKLLEMTIPLANASEPFERNLTRATLYLLALISISIGAYACFRAPRQSRLRDDPLCGITAAVFGLVLLIGQLWADLLAP